MNHVKIKSVEQGRCWSDFHKEWKLILVVSNKSKINKQKTINQSTFKTLATTTPPSTLNVRDLHNLMSPNKQRPIRLPSASSSSKRPSILCTKVQDQHPKNPVIPQTQIRVSESVFNISRVIHLTRVPISAIFVAVVALRNRIRPSQYAAPVIKQAIRQRCRTIGMFPTTDGVVDDNGSQRPLTDSEKQQIEQYEKDMEQYGVDFAKSMQQWTQSMMQQRSDSFGTAPTAPVQPIMPRAPCFCQSCEQNTT
ncbi:hypothetical protein L596_021768 [Steinernema carpocapsae]|uniref:Uncharacterized protein n=1 Tax=Steinernema carpocapsae TaxID=34508 RepID=A0A4U5MJR4_STECR|nr:hypothetical protein L596_021768 [Steinernema carpocapsae]